MPISKELNLNFQALLLGLTGLTATIKLFACFLPEPMRGGGGYDYLPFPVYYHQPSTIFSPDDPNLMHHPHVVLWGVIVSSIFGVVLFAGFYRSFLKLKSKAYTIKTLFYPSIRKSALFCFLVGLTYWIPKTTEICSMGAHGIVCGQTPADGLGSPLFFGTRFYGDVGGLGFYPMNFLINVGIYYFIAVMLFFAFCGSESYAPKT